MGKRSIEGEPDHQDAETGAMSKALIPMPSKTSNKKAALIQPPVPCAHYEIRYMTPNRELGSFTVKLSAPEEDEECPLTLDAMATSSLEFLPNVPFLSKRPDLKKMTLPCGHSFSAMPVFYNMCKCSPLCPCCRQGVEGNVCADSIPDHFRDTLMERITRMDIQQQSEDEQTALAQILASESFAANFQDVANLGNLTMALEFTDLPNETGECTYVVFNVNLVQLPDARIGSDTGGRLIFSPIPSHQRLLTQLHNVSDFVEISIRMRIPGVGIARLESTGRVSMRRPPGMHSVRGASDGVFVRDGPTVLDEQVSVSTFDILFAGGPEMPYISNVSWSPDYNTVRWMPPQP
jgi:hypothetical protein